MKKYIASALFQFVFASLFAQQPAFPGAVGFGRFATGGRTGTVYHVTNLNDSGAGSFRDAVSQPNRVVVFDVAGVIHIQSRIVFAKNLTIAGQTAPGEGVVIYGDGVSFSGADNLICRYMRFRMGVNGSSGKDAAGIANGAKMIFDHVSVTWGRDETFSISWDNKGTEPSDITIQNSIIGQGLMTHSAGGLVQTSGGVTLFRNLYIDNHTRNPKVKGLNQYVNNVVYNWGGGGCYILGDSEGPSWATIVNNYFINGPASTASVYSRANENFQLYASGNYADSDRDGTLNGSPSMKGDYGPAFWIDSLAYWKNVLSTDPKKIPQYHPEIPGILTARESYEWIVQYAGSNLPVRDQVDLLLIGELISLGTQGAIITSEAQLPTNGPGMIFKGNKRADSDQDGMPDDWEDANGTARTTPDAMVIRSDGWINIEHYINNITAPVEYLKYPVNIRADTVSLNSVVLRWVNMEEKATRIVVGYGKTQAFNDSLVVDGRATTVRIPGLDKNTLYYFRLKSGNDRITSLWSDPFTITTSSEAIPPLPAGNPSPATGSVLKNNRDILLGWENRTGIMAGTLYFDIFLGKSIDSMQMVVSQTTLTNRLFTELEENTTWYWRVRTTNLLGVNEGVTWSFTTGAKVIRTPVLHIPFDEPSGNTATDITGKITATVYNFTPSRSTGKIGNCLYSPGSPANSHLKVPYFEGLSTDTGPFTISLWFKSPGGIADSYLFHKGMHDKAYGGNGKWTGIQYKGTTLTFAIDDDVTKTALNISGANQWFNNQWHHMACVRDQENDKLLVYIDGQKKAETSDNTGDISETGDLILVNRNGYFDNPYPGCLDELIIYHDALSASEITELFTDTTLTSIPAVAHENPVMIWPNPFQDHVNIEIGTELPQEVLVTIYDITGNVICKKRENAFGWQFIKISGLSGLKAGIYFCVILYGEQHFSRKISKIK